MRSLFAASFALVLLVAACGGDTESDPSDGSSAGGSSAAGSGTAGSGTAGSATAGSGTAGSGTAGSGATWADCNMPGDCTLDFNGCCWPCGLPTPADLDAVNKAKLAEHKAAVCDDPAPACPKCATTTNPALVGICALGPGKCTILDLSTSNLTECGDSSDCVLRFQDCCECGATGPITALAKTKLQAYAQTVCAPATGCAECAPSYPPDLAAKCDAGHCVVVGK